MQSCSYVYRVLVALTFCVLVTWTIAGVHCCQNDPSLYFIDDHTIKCAAVDTLDQQNPSFQTVVSNLAEGTAIDIDVRNRMIYWSDTHAWTINRMNLTSGEVKVIIRDNIGEVYSIAVEWESGLIYWTDLIFERIEVAKLDGSSRRTLITQDVDSPTGIAVDPRNGYVVWADHNYMAPKIMRADLTGENHQQLYTTFHGLPLYVTIDYSESRVYWTDIHFFYTFIGSIGVDGRAYQGLGYLHPDYYPFGLAIFQSNFYWADQNFQGVSWFNFKSSSPAVHTRQNLSPYFVLGVTISDPSTQPMATGQPCAVNNGNCSHLCLLAPGGGRKCACPQGVDLSENGTTCANGSTLATQAPPLPDVQVRLVGSSLASRGRVELRYNGEWGTICDDYWGIAEAHVICRMLNYSGAEFAPLNAFYGPGSASMPILLDNVKCRGDESTIAACRHNGWRQHDCDHSEDASVVCWRETAPPVQGPTLAPGPHPELQVRLYGGDTYYQGGVEIYLNGTWGTICDDSWGIEEANVICRMLNFTEGALSTQCCGFYNGYGVASQIWLDDVHCVGDEESIAECRHGGYGSHNCRHTEDVGVICKHTPIATPTQIVRLADGARESEGRVEIFNDGEWGTVCDDHWDIKDADVVCRMLNYSRALRAPTKAFFGRGNGKIWLGSVNCRGNETSLLQCGHQGWNVDSCGHHEDASVICESEAAHFESNSFILACGSGRNLLYHIPLDTDMSEKGLPLALQTNKPLAVTFHGKDQMAYWTEQSGSVIRANLNGSSRQVIATGLTSPAGIAIDYIAQNLYIADQDGIKVSRLDGLYQMLLINSSEACHGIALDSEAGHIYYTLIGISPQIRRADMDGKNAVILVNVTSQIRRTTLDIALDKVNRRLYFSDESNNLVKYLDLASYKTHSVPSGNPRRPVGLTLFNGTLYWTGDGAAEMFSGAIYKADIKNASFTSTIRKVADLLSYPTGIYAHDGRISESPALNHSCAQDSGGCSHLCLINPSGYRCVCPGGPCQTTVSSTVSVSSSTSSSSSVTTPNLSIATSSTPSKFYSSPTSSTSSSSSVTTPHLSVAISSTPSKVYSSSTNLAPTTTSSFNSISATPTPITDYCSTNDPCENGGSCQMDGPNYRCVCIQYFHGQHCSINYSGGTVVLTITVPGSQLNITELTDIIVKILNSFCEGESNRCPIPLSGDPRRKRATSQVTFISEDIIVTEPKPVDENLQVELAAVKTMPDGSSVVISSDKLTQILLESVDEINQGLNGTIINIAPKFPGPTIQTTPNSEKTTTTQTTPVKTVSVTPDATTQAPGGPGQLAASTGGSNGGVIGGVVVAVLLIIIMVIALAVWYFRVKMPSLPFSYKRKTNVPDPGPRVASFENPGYDNATGFATGDDGLYSDLPQPVVLSPYEDLNEFGAASNPIYSEFGMAKLGSQDKRGGSMRRSDVEKNMFGSQPKMSWVDNEDLTNDKGNDGDFGSKVSLRSTASIKKVKVNQVDITVQVDEEESDKKESAMVPDNGVCKEQENKGQTVLCLETGEELEKASEM